MDAAVTGLTIAVDNQDPSSSAYPHFSQVALRAGVRHSLSVGLPMAQRVVGGLNIYGSAELPFTGGAVELAKTFAGYAAVAVANAASYHNAAALAEQLQAAMQSRAVIEQAKGIIMAEQRCDADQAFKVLALGIAEPEPEVASGRRAPHRAATHTLIRTCSLPERVACTPSSAARCVQQWPAGCPEWRPHQPSDRQDCAWRSAVGSMFQSTAGTW